MLCLEEDSLGMVLDVVCPLCLCRVLINNSRVAPLPTERRSEMKLSPIGDEPNLSICLSIGHDWQQLFVSDREFRFCNRCNRGERKEYFGEDTIWVVNEIRPSVV